MKKNKMFKAGRKTLLSLAIVGSAVGIAIIAVVALNYASFSGNGFYDGNVKIGGSTLSHEIDNDVYILVIASILVGSSLFLLFRILSEKRMN
ncbi:hypothetical protein M1137_03020 [Candidatus Parvarchaeota archaeon]|jgi:hypothetical protein|nr:hypothetical protein [Candidatus Parvarchaeota archaeon]